jgi:hypothetical protein
MKSDEWSPEGAGEIGETQVAPNLEVAQQGPAFIIVGLHQTQ